jgi:hypothetical protein
MDWWFDCQSLGSISRPSESAGISKCWTFWATTYLLFASRVLQQTSWHFNSTKRTILSIFPSLIRRLILWFLIFGLMITSHISSYIQAKWERYIYRFASHINTLNSCFCQMSKWLVAKLASWIWKRCLSYLSLRNTDNVCQLKGRDTLDISY